MRDPAAPITVQVVAASGPRQCVEASLSLPAGARVQDAVRAAQALPQFAGLALASMPVGVWGRKAGAMQDLHDGDRLEFYRRLQVDPKVARRQRFAQQGAGTAGLFARRRPGAKPGY